MPTPIQYDPPKRLGESPRENRGGVRRGAGHPPDLDKKLVEAKQVARHLQAALNLGLGELGREYVGLLRLAIQVAKGDFDNQRPNVRMLTMLIELLPKLVTPIAEGEESPYHRLLKDIHAEVVNIQNNYGPVAPGRPSDPDSPEGTGLS